MRIVQATMQNLDEAAELFNEYRMFYKQKPDFEGCKKFLFERMSHLQSVIFLVIDDHKAMGFVQLYPSFSSVSMERVWILNDLYVKEQYRGRGAAQKLLDAARMHAIHTKAKGLQLATAIDNTAAQRLYEKNGYLREDMFYYYFLTV